MNALRVGWLFIAALAAGALIGCTALPTIETSVCGNLVLDVGEDCDGFSEFGDTAVCGAPESEQACHYLCDEELSAACPEGWGCGADGRCRQASGELERAAGSPWSFAVEDFTLGDVDGDQHLDLIGSDLTSVVIRWGTPTGEFPVEDAIRTRQAVGPSLFTDVDDDGLLDVVSPLFSGIFVMLGQPDRTLRPVAYQPFSIDGVGDVRLVPVRSQSLTLNHDLIAVFANVMVLFTNGLDQSVTLPGGNVASSLAGRVAVGDLDAPGVLNEGRDEFALAFSDETRVWVMSTTGSEATLELVERQQVRLPLGMKVESGATMADVDGDGLVDLLISVQGAAASHVAVAYNEPADPGHLADAVLEPAFRQLSPDPWPLAVGDFNQDGKADYVAGDAVFITDFLLVPQIGPPRAMVPTISRTTNTSWAHAAAADFNGDGRADVAVSTPGLEGIEFLLSTGVGFFNRFRVDTDGPPTRLRAADFDGDFVGDLAFAISGEGVEKDRIAVSFGATSGGPSETIDMGPLDLIRQVEPIRSVVDIETLDLVDDLMVVSADFPAGNSQSVAILQGNSGRRLLSPFALNDEAGSEVPHRVIVGNFLELLADGEDPRDIIAVAEPARNFGGGVTPPPDAGNRLPFNVWVVPSDGPEAALSAADASRTEMPAEAVFESRCGEWAAGDLDGDGWDELVGTDGSFRCYGFGSSPDPRIVVASTGGGAQTPSVSPLEISGGFRAPRSLQLVDLDGDEDLDLLVLFAGESQGGAGAVGDEPASGSGVVVLWNEGGRLDVGRRSAIQVPGAFRMFEVAPMQLDADPVLELAILADGGIYAADIDLSDSSYGAPLRLIEQDGHGQMATGDVNSDGLDDVTWTVGRDVHVFLGVAAPPLGGAIVSDAVEEEEAQ